MRTKSEIKGRIEFLDKVRKHKETSRWEKRKCKALGKELKWVLE